MPPLDFSSVLGTILICETSLIGSPLTVILSVTFHLPEFPPIKSKIVLFIPSNFLNKFYSKGNRFRIPFV